eukprot:TRINITY_DN8658_c0_g1_i5.p2 TRINITY_DN8658_c0_g1~~TRINITY_DN8658_c0_g1_i5.p2  ORF type:complete len:112 (-),score=42.18 TRINITY_DN8658_c0_g1_i5:377-712(-)
MNDFLEEERLLHELLSQRKKKKEQLQNDFHELVQTKKAMDFKSQEIDKLQEESSTKEEKVKGEFLKSFHEKELESVLDSISVITTTECVQTRGRQSDGHEATTRRLEQTKN